jgi:ligand-binding sensor domain-containing protein
MLSYNGTLHVPGGLVNTAWNHIGNQAGFYEFNKATGWRNYNGFSKPQLAGYTDFIDVAINPANEKDVFYGSFSKGLVEKLDTSIVNQWTNKNSTLGQGVGDTGSVRVSGLLFDYNGNLWVANHDAKNPISVYTNKHKWVQLLNYSQLGTNLLGGPMAQDNAGQIWMIGEYGYGIVVYNYGADLTTTADDKAWQATTGTGKGNLPNILVYALAIDKDGYIWVGTATGVCVFYCPEQAVTGSGCDAQQVIYTVPEDGHLGYLLATEEVLTVAVDGANRKWFGTRTSGVYMMSSDGTQQLQHFTSLNSPLLSNTVSSITVDNKTGEVFFGTDKGIISYQGDANEGDNTLSYVYVTPNPVRPEYSGNITVRGVAYNAIVKIADVTGKLVWETQSQGGQAIWDGNRLDGTRAASGVYLVYVITPDGQTTATAKFLMLK